MATKNIAKKSVRGKKTAVKTSSQRKHQTQASSSQRLKAKAASSPGSQAALLSAQRVKTEAPSQRKSKARAETPHRPQNGLTGILAWFLFGLAACLLLAFVLLGVYRFYLLQDGFRQVEAAQKILQTELTRQAGELGEVGTMRERQEAAMTELRQRKEQEEILMGRIHSLTSKLSTLEPQLIQRHQMRQLIYLAERQRHLDASAEQVLNLLSQARSIALNHPGTASISLLQALAADIQTYQNIPVPERSRIVQELDVFLMETRSLPRFPIFVEQERAAEDAEDSFLSPEGQEYFMRLKNAFAHLSDFVRIYKREENAQRFLTEEEERLIRLVIASKVLQAQLAAMQGEEELYRGMIAKLSEMLSLYYPSSDVKIRLLAQLEDLKQQDIKSPSLPALRSAESLSY